MRQFFKLKVFQCYSQCCSSLIFCCRFEFVQLTLCLFNFCFFIILLSRLVSLFSSRMVKTSMDYILPAFTKSIFSLLPEKVLFAKSLSGQHLILFVQSNQLLLVYHDFMIFNVFTIQRTSCGITFALHFLFFFFFILF